MCSRVSDAGLNLACNTSKSYSPTVLIISVTLQKQKLWLSSISSLYTIFIHFYIDIQFEITGEEDTEGAAVEKAHNPICPKHETFFILRP